MQSLEYLIKEVKEKLLEVEKALSACDAEQCLLNENFTSIKEAVGDSFKRHIGTFQCRVKWLVCHADSIYHLKEGSLSHQVAELELISNELKNCLEAYDCTLNDTDEMKLMAKNVLQDASELSLQPCETGCMTFVSQDVNMEESIISFGDIDVHSTYELIKYKRNPDNGVIVLGKIPEKRNSIEMDVESFGMHHLTAQLANSDMEDFERIEMEMQSLNPDVIPDTTQMSQVDSAFDEEIDYSKSEWLHPSSISQPEIEKEWMIHLINAAKSDDELSGVSECTNKVPSWLKTCQEEKSWIKCAPSNSLTSQITVKWENPVPGKSSLVNGQCTDDNFSSKAQKSSQANMLYDENEVSVNIRHINGIFCSSNSKFLRVDVENLRNSIYCLDSALDSMGLQEKETNNLVDMSSSVSNTTLDHFMDISKAPNTNFLKIDVVANVELASNDVLDQSLMLENKKTDAMDSSKEYAEMAFSTFNSNIDHVNQVFERSHLEYLNQQRITEDSCITAAMYTKITPFVEHIQKIRQRPNQMFLRRTGKSKMLDPELCVWLRDSTNSTCSQCFDECSFNDKHDGKWIKTATDW